MSDEKKHEYVLITGASSGIGKALAYEFASHGNNLILVARRGYELQKIADDIMMKNHVKISIIAIDLMRKEAADQIYDFCIQNNLTVKVLINNAGMGAQGKFMEIPLSKQEQIIELNNMALIRMCYAFLPDMKEQRSSTIVNISSTTAFMPLANEAVYAASKAFVLSFSQALYEELKPFKVKICTVCPGVTNTEFFRSAGFALDNFKAADPCEFAKYAYKRIMKAKPLSVHRFSNQMIAIWSRLFPRGSVRKISSRFG